MIGQKSHGELTYGSCSYSMDRRARLSNINNKWEGIEEYEPLRSARESDAVDAEAFRADVYATAKVHGNQCLTQLKHGFNVLGSHTTGTKCAKP